MLLKFVFGFVKELYQFGLNLCFEWLLIVLGGLWVFFLGMFLGGGSGMLECVVVLCVGVNGKIENLMLIVIEIEMVDCVMWSVLEVLLYLLFVWVDYVWGKGEDYFGKYVFDVDVWMFDFVVN